MTGRLALFGPLALLLCACGGTTTKDATLSNAQAYAQTAASATALQSNLNALPPLATMPTSGTATFAGYAGLTYTNTAAQRAELVGTANLSADFANSSITGSLTNFIGGTVTDPKTNSITNPLPYVGSLKLANGTIGPGNAATANVSGKLTTVGLTVNVNSTVKGGFVGNPLQGVELDTAQAAAASLAGTTVTVNGVTQQSPTLFIVGQKQ
jgi:hypothetical protein